jgi:hypothetical protein
MTLLFVKRLNDTFEENAEKLIKGGKSEKEAYENKNRHYFFIPKEARWSVLSKVSENIGERIDHVCRIIQRETPDLDGVLTNTKYNDKRKYLMVLFHCQAQTFLFLQVSSSGIPWMDCSIMSTTFLFLIVFERYYSIYVKILAFE